MAEKHEKIAEEYPVIRQMYQLVLDFSLLVKDFPRDSRFILGDRILVNCYTLLDGLIATRFAREKGPILKKANLNLDTLRFQIRLCLDTKIISAKQYGRLAESIDQVGRMVGGWLKQSAAETGRSRMRRPGGARGLVEQQQSEELFSHLAHGTMEKLRAKLLWASPFVRSREMRHG